MGTGIPEGVERGAVVAESRRVRLRIMIPADVPTVAAIERSTFSTPWQRETYERFLDPSSAVEVWVAEDLDRDADANKKTPNAGEGEVLGYAVLWKAADQGELANLAVTRGARGHGIGGRLLDRVLERCSDVGLRALYLEVRSSNQAAIVLYQQRGFRTVGVRKNYYTRPREDALVMMKSFPADAEASDR